MEINDGAALQLTSEMTVEFWVKRQSINGLDYAVEKGGSWNYGAADYSVALHNSGFNYMLTFLFNGGYRGGGSISDTTTWHHCAVTARSGDADPILYIDGNQVPVIYRFGPSLLTFYPSTAPLHLGALVDYAVGWRFYSKAQFDEISVYNRVLSGDEIKAIYNAGSFGKTLGSPPACAAITPGPVAWWPANGNTNDVIGNANASYSGTYPAGEVDRAFNIVDSASTVRIPAATALNIGAANGMTIEGWINPPNSTTGGPVVEWAPATGYGLVLWVNYVSAGSVFVNLVDTTGAYHWFWTDGNLIQGNKFQHLAVTYDKTTGMCQVFVDGVQRYSQPQGIFTPQTSPDLYLGYRPPGGGRTAANFTGLIDEMSLYNRVLSQTEIQAICNAGSAGKCTSSQPIAPSISTQPADQTVIQNGTATFTVVATGTPAPNYQWYKNDINHPVGANSSTLMLANVQMSDAGGYFVKVSNNAGNVTSRTATLTVLTAPTITTQPLGQMVRSGTTMSFSVQATGSGTLAYQWYKNNNATPVGANSSTLTLANVQLPDGANYYVKVSNSAGTATSQQAPLTLISPPLDQEVYQGDSVTFSVTAAGPRAPNLTYQWVFTDINGVPVEIADATAPALSMAQATCYGIGLYSVVVSDGSAGTLILDAALFVNEWYGAYLPLRGPRQDYTFRGNATYRVGSAVQLYGTTTIEGGAVIKYVKNTGAKLIINGTLNCDTGPYLPATATADDDNSVGFIINFPATPSGYYADTAFEFCTDGSTSLHNLHISYAQTAIRYHGSTPAGGTAPTDTARHVQITHCQTGFKSEGNTSATPKVPRTLNLRNVLISDVSQAINGSCFGGTAQHITVDGCTSSLAHNTDSTSQDFQFVNCVLGSVSSLGSGLSLTASTHNGFYACPQFGSSAISGGLTSPFQTVDSGHHYLADSSIFRGAGTTDIEAGLLQDLKARSTHPPVSLPRGMQVKGQLALSSQIARYTTGAPDIGYWYDALDYTVCMIDVTGGKITVLPGTFIASRTEFYDQTEQGQVVHYMTLSGFTLRGGSAFLSDGRPFAGNRFARAQMVQEGPYGYPANFASTSFMFLLSGNNPEPALDLRFSTFNMPPECHHILGGYEPSFGDWVSPIASVQMVVRDCTIAGGKLILGTQYTGEQGSGNVDWMNTLFDKVDVRLSPSKFSAVQVSVSAYNNLFRRCLLHLEPVQTFSGNWVFKDNLFDKTIFEEPGTALFDHDYNGYWPCLGQELMLEAPFFQSAHLQFQGGRDDVYGTDDRILPAVPPYQSGPLGGFYLPAPSLLYHAGSRTPAAAGLYHYTAETSQVKEGDTSGHNVSIGLHYLATSSPTSSQPKDTDGDGIPDYVENWHGDGDYNSHTDTETSWLAQYTVSGVFDPTSTIYDDIDLDGDGMVGRVEKALFPTNPQPLVPNNPLTPQVATGGAAESQKFKLPFVNYDFVTGIADVRLTLETGAEPAVQAVLKDSTDGSALLLWNTTFDSPGQHFLQPRIYLKTSVPDGPSIIDAAGPLLPFKTDNALQFENLYSTFDTAGMFLYAQTDPGTVYSIELSDANGAHLNTISGTVPTDSSEINVTWDLRRDDVGQTLYTGDAVTAAFTVTPPGSPQQTRNFYGSRTELGYGDGPFTVAYQFNKWSGKGNPLDQYFQFAVADVLLTPRADVQHYTSIFNDFTPLAPNYQQYGGAGYTANEARKNELLADLERRETPTRNFYWWGHGTPSDLGDTQFVTISASDVASRLGNYLEVYVPPIAPSAPIMRTHRDHRYRFVFIDGCLAGNIPTWAEAFGIPGEEIDYAKIASHTERAQAFLGFRLLQGAPCFEQEVTDKQDTLDFFFTLWMSDLFSLEDCVKACSRMGHPGQPYEEIQTIDIKYPLGAYRGSCSESLAAAPWNKKFYGYPRITRSNVKP